MLTLPVTPLCSCTRDRHRQLHPSTKSLKVTSTENRCFMDVYSVCFMVSAPYTASFGDVFGEKSRGRDDDELDQPGLEHSASRDDLKTQKAKGYQFMTL